MTYQFTQAVEIQPTIIALHSSASSGSQWKNLALDAQGRFQVQAPDLPGYGHAKSAAGSDLNGVASSAAPILQMIERCDQPVHLVGHSNGAGVALKIALMRPELIKSLTLFEPASFHFLSTGSVQDRRHFQEIRLLSGLLTAAAACGDAHGGMRGFIDFWNGRGSWAQLSQPARDRLSAQAPAVMADFANAFGERWTLADLKQIEIPTLVMMGLESPEVTQNLSAQVAGALPKANLAMLPGLNHMAPMFNCEWVNPRILQHIASAERPAAQIPWPIRCAA